MDEAALLDHFRSVFDGQETATQLKDHLFRKRPYRMLCATNALTKDEWGQVEGRFRGGTDQAREVLRTVRKKDSLQCYLGFNNVIWEGNVALGKKLFPFAEHLTEPLKPKGLAGLDARGKLVLSEKYRTVLWLAASSADLDSISLVLEHFGCKCNVPVKTANRFLYKELLLHRPSRDSAPLQLCLVSLQPSEHFSAQAVAVLARIISPQPCIAMLSGMCIADKTTARLGDIVVIQHHTTSAELQHMTELWKLQAKADWLRASLLRERRPRWSCAEQSLVLARLYLELNLPEEQQSQWFKGLSWDASKPHSDNHGLREYVPQPEEVWKDGSSQGQWNASENDVLPLAPCASLLDQAKASLLYAHSCFPLQQPSDPRVVFSKASLLTGVEGAVCCLEAVKFYNGIQDAELKGLNYFAAVGVSQHPGDYAEPEYRNYASCASAVYMFQVLKYHVKKGND